MLKVINRIDTWRRDQTLTGGPDFSLALKTPPTSVGIDPIGRDAKGGSAFFV